MEVVLNEKDDENHTKTSDKDEILVATIRKGHVTYCGTKWSKDKGDIPGLIGSSASEREL